MYRQPPHPSRARSLLPSPAPDELCESESNLVAALEEKRREFDGDIEAFKLRKEEEFRIFEEELRSQKRRNTSNSDSLHSISPLSGLSSLNNKELHANGPLPNDKKAKNVNLGGLKPILGPSRPSLSIDKVTINGTTTPPVGGIPPLGNNLSHSPTNLSAVSRPPSSTGQESGQSSTPSEKDNNFEGLFTPGYLELLETRTPSLPQNSASPSTVRSERPVAAPMLSSSSLPSALRTASDMFRKRKHVTFRLAHSVVVDPSSSYEDTPSPSSDQSEKSLADDGAEAGIETPASQLRKQRMLSGPEEGLTSPAKGFNEASFFSLDEELQSCGERPPAHQEDQEDALTEPDGTEQDAAHHDANSPTFSSGSLPIDIVKPSSSFRLAMSD